MYDVFKQLRDSAIGINSKLRVIDLDGNEHEKRRIYLDSAATCLQIRPVADAVSAYLSAACANSHTDATATGKDTTRAVREAHDDLKLLMTASDDDRAVFMGSGTTQAMCFVADAIQRKSQKRFVIASALEHHSNILPWMRRFQLLYVRANLDGTFDVDHLKELLADNAGQVAAVSVTAVSNVTGVITPLREIAELSHEADALLVVDAAQAASHIQIDKTALEIDVLVGSGHKMYAPGSPGWIIAPLSFFDGLGWSIGAIGGGSVDRVELGSVRLKKDPSERYEAGTPNIPGAIALGASSYTLRQIGMDRVLEHERKLVAYCLEMMQSVPGAVVYGPLNADQKTALVSFNLGGIPHSAVAAILNDFFAIQVRNGCFCAQPYTRQQIAAACEARGYCEPVYAGKTGMVRASFGVYSDKSDVDALIEALRWIVQHEDELKEQYHENEDGSWQHTWFRSTTGFGYRSVVEQGYEHGWE